MRRIATLVATGAVATAAAITFAAAPASAATNPFGGTANTTTSGSNMSVATTTHGWLTHYTTPAGVSGKGYFTLSSTHRLTVWGTVTDKRSGSYYACVRLRAVDKRGGYATLTIRNAHHHTTGSFGKYVTTFSVAHLYVAKCDITKTGKTPHYTGKWYRRF